MRNFFGALIVMLLSTPLRGDCTMTVHVDDIIGPGTVDYLERAEREARKRKCGSILVLMNTPGGNLQSTRLIVERVINSEIPWLCYVHPAGAHAGSAGAIILQACHVTGAEETTNLGAATPVSGGGETIPEDLRNKMVNDTMSWLDSLTELRGRNREFGRDIVKTAKAVSAKEALKIRAIDFAGTSVESFLEFAKARTVKLQGGTEAKVSVSSLASERVDFPPDVRRRLLDFITHPQFAYLVFMGSLGLLYFEITHPGMIAPGVFGALGLIVSLISFHMLNIQWGGLALMVLGLGFLVAEAFVPSFGALGLGGIVALIAGSLLLYEPGAGSQLPLGTILPTALGVGLFMMFLGFAAYKTRLVRKNTGSDALLGAEGRVTRLEGATGLRGSLEVRGEIWKFESETELKIGDSVRVASMNGMTLKVVRL